MEFQSCTGRNQAQGNQGAVPGVPQVLEVYGKPWNTGSDLPALSLGRCPGTQKRDFAAAPPIFCVSQSCHCSTAAVHERAAKSQDTRDGHSIKHEEGRSWHRHGTEHPGPCSVQEGTACVHTLTLSGLPHRTPLPCLTKVTATLWLWPELLHRGRRRCPPCRHKCCAQPCLPLHPWRSDTTHRIRDSSAASPG